MDWLEQTTAWLRDWLAQQSWLDAWQPIIAATPDWALLAAAIATPILLWILLRLVWPRRSNAKHSPQFKNVAAGGIEFAIGEVEGSPAIRQLISALGGSPERSEYDDSYYLNFKETGVWLRFDKSGKLTTAFFYAEGSDGYSQYRGALPRNLSFADTRRDVEAKIGRPKSRGDGGIPYWTSYGGVGVTYQSKSKTDLANKIGHITLTERGLFLDPVAVAAAPAAPKARPPHPAAAAANTIVASGTDDAAPPDAASDTRQKGEEPDPEFDAILEEVRIACETDPERGLAMIDHYVGVVGEQRFLRFSRVLAYRRILVGSEADARSGRYGHTLDEVARRLSPHKLECGIKALDDIAAIEREDPNYFCDGDVKENILDAVCHLMERARPGIVQQTLGWTKLDYFGAGRVSSINEKAPGGKEVQRVPEEVKDRVFAVRFKADAIVRSALAMLASGPGSGRGIGFMLFERLPDPNERVIGDRIHVGSVDIGENGDWWYTPKGDGPSMGGGPTYDEG